MLLAITSQINVTVRPGTCVEIPIAPIIPDHTYTIGLQRRNGITVLTHSSCTVTLSNMGIEDLNIHKGQPVCLCPSSNPA